VSAVVNEPQVLIAIDVAGSTEAKILYDDLLGSKMVIAALDYGVSQLRIRDPGLKVSPGSAAGDSILLTGGVHAVIDYWAAVKFQSDFRSKSGNRLALKIAIGYGVYEEFEDEFKVKHARGREIDYLFRIVAKCPQGETVVTPSILAMLTEAGYADKLIIIKEELEGISGLSVWAESDGVFVIPHDKRQKAVRKPEIERRLETKNADRRAQETTTTVFVDSFSTRVLLIFLAVAALMWLYYFLFGR